VKLFAVSTIALNESLSAAHNAAPMLAVSTEVAEQKATERALVIFPEAEGYMGHSVVVDEVSIKMVMRAWLARLDDQSGPQDGLGDEAGLVM
jgi:hypothetical protein